MIWPNPAYWKGKQADIKCCPLLSFTKDDPMQITVRVKGVLIQKIGAARFSVTLSSPVTIADLLQHLQAQYPSLSDEVERAVTIINGVHKPATTLLQDGQEVALLMPIAGG